METVRKIDARTSGEYSILVELIKLVVVWRRFIIFAALIPTIFVVAVSFFWPKTYKAAVTIIPSEGSSSPMSSVLGSAPALSMFSGLLKGFESIDNSDKLQYILKSHSLTKSMIEDLQLQPYLFPSAWDTQTNRWKNPSKAPKMDDLVSRFQKKMLTVKADKKGLISIEIIARDPELASRIANHVGEGLQAFINKHVLTLGKKNRLFVEEQLGAAEKDLANAEQNLKEYEQKNKIYDIRSQTELTLGLYSGVTSEIMGNEAQLTQIEKLYGKNNPQYQNLYLKNRALSQQLEKMETEKKSTNKGASKLFGELDKVPQMKLDYLQLQRDMQVLQKVFFFLKEQYEIAKINELRDEISFQIVDSAHPPDHAYWPKKKLMAVLSFIGFGLLAILALFVKEYIWPDMRRAFTS